MDTAHHIVPSKATSGHLVFTLDELLAWGESLGRQAQPPLIITIAGELGAGKTTLIQAICRGYGVTEEVTSPTYAIVHEYTSSPKSVVYHLDLYRLSGPQDLQAIGWDDIMSSRALVLIEWPERAAGQLSSETLPLVLDHLPDDPSRRVLLAG